MRPKINYTSTQRRRSISLQVHKMADIQAQTQSSNRGRRRPRGRGGSRGKGGAKTKGAAAIDSTLDPNARRTDGLRAGVDTAATTDVSASQTEEPQDDSQDLCWICAEPVKYYAVSVCNHRTCHVCALRLRVLYKKLDCTFCKVRVTSVHLA